MPERFLGKELVDMIVIFIMIAVYILMGVILGLVWLLRQLKILHVSFKVIDFFIVYFGVVVGWPILFPLLMSIIIDVEARQEDY